MDKITSVNPFFSTKNESISNNYKPQIDSNNINNSFLNPVTGVFTILLNI